MAYENKSTVEDIRNRFDNDVERFSTLSTGQSTTIDAPLVLSLITEAAAAVNPNATESLDIGCGAGNYTLKLLEKLPGMNVTLVDLSMPMLERAQERITNFSFAANSIKVHQSDIRQLSLDAESFDIVMAAAVLHHLRAEEEWRAVFEKIFKALKPGGSFWISDMIEHTTSPINSMMVARYGQYLTGLKDEAYKEHVFAYVAKEDSPRPIMFQLDLLREVGFREVEILHKNSIFAAFGGIK